MLVVLLRENKQVVKIRPEYFTTSKFPFFALYTSRTEGYKALLFRYLNILLYFSFFINHMQFIHKYTSFWQMQQIVMR